MQSTIQIIPKEEYLQLVKIKHNAYPFTVLSDEQKQELTQECEKSIQKGFGRAFYGLYRQEKMIGAMKVYDFSMNLFGNQILVGGLGSVAVDLLHKKEKACKEMVQFFLQDFHNKGACLTALYAFNLGFYRRMGFGFGNKTSHYYIETASLPFYSKKHLRFYETNDRPQLEKCYERYAHFHHGMMERSEYEWNSLLNSDALRIVVFAPDEDDIKGYLIFKFSMKEGMKYDLQLVELVYHNRESWRTLIGFLQSQADQSPRIKLDTQDEDFYFLLNNPHNLQPNQVRLHHQSNVEEVGIMYRIVNVKRYFEVMKGHNFGGETVQVCFHIEDDLLAANDGKTVVHFEKGHAKVQRIDAPFEVEVNMKVGEFSALAMGGLGFRKLYQYGMVSISDMDYLESVHRLLDFGTKPICKTLF
ncbi:MAG: GNAT family N-acetyltransferase [Chitinophagales bacterium]